MELLTTRLETAQLMNYFCSDTKKKPIFIVFAILKALKTRCIIKISISNSEDYNIVTHIDVIKILACNSKSIPILNTKTII